MSKVNIGGDPNDPNYRYKRELIVLEKASKGMRKIANIRNIQKQLKCDKAFIDKFYAEIKRRGNPMFGDGLFKGNISAPEMEKILVALTDKYILCPRCKLPEWDGSICSACGEMKATKMKKDDSVESDKCGHMSSAVEIVKNLYKKRIDLGAGEELQRLEEDIDYFWGLPSCESDHISKEKCGRVYKSFCAIFNEPQT